MNTIHISLCLLFLLSYSFIDCASEVTFNNVTIRGYAMNTEIFNKTITSSNSLKEYIPKYPRCEIVIAKQMIPILYENSIADIENMYELTLANNQISEIQVGAFSNLPLLGTLSLKDNKLETIQENVFKGLLIHTLDLSSNNISRIDSKAFDNLTYLSDINLVDNKINKWNPDWFRNTPHLKRISIQNNSIETIPSRAFKNLHGKRQLGSLKISILLSYNKIKKIDDSAFKDLAEIDHLWLDNNLIEEFNDKLLENTNVYFLKLIKNNINCLDGDLVKILKAETSSIDENPYDCNCLKTIMSWAEANRKNVVAFISEMKCDQDRERAKLNSMITDLTETIRKLTNEIKIFEMRN